MAITADTKYAVIKIKGHQYKVSEGQEIKVDHIDEGKPEAQVLLFVDGEKVEIGKPHIKNAKIELKVITEMVKGEKIDVLKYKAKSRYRKKIGYRHTFTTLQIDKLAIK